MSRLVTASKYKQHSSLRCRDLFLIAVFGVFIFHIFRFFCDRIFMESSNSDSEISSIHKRQKQLQKSINMSGEQEYYSSSSIIYRLVDNNEKEVDQDRNRRSAGWRRYAAYRKVDSNDADGGVLGLSDDVEIPMSVYDWTQCMASSSDGFIVQRQFTKLLSDSPYKSFFFETRGVTSKSMRVKQFEFVLVDSPQLAYYIEQHGADSSSFSEYINDLPKDCAGTVFDNLGRNAKLIVPQMLDGVDSDLVYSNLASFLRGAPIDQSNKLWKLASKTYQDTVQERGNRPTWFSTSGLGVYWLHFRLDLRPKYYQYSPFASDGS